MSKCGTVGVFLYLCMNKGLWLEGAVQQCLAEVNEELTQGQRRSSGGCMGTALFCSSLKKLIFNWRGALLIAEIRSIRKASPELLLSHFLPLPLKLSLSLPLLSLGSLEQFFFCAPLWPPVHLPLHSHCFVLFVNLPLWLRWPKAEQELLQHSASPENQLQGMGRVWVVFQQELCCGACGRGRVWRLMEREFGWRTRSSVLCGLGQDLSWDTAQACSSSCDGTEEGLELW